MLDDSTTLEKFGVWHKQRHAYARDWKARSDAARLQRVRVLSIAHSCLQIHNTFGSWKIHKPAPYSYYLPMPNQLQSRAARDACEPSTSRSKHL